MTSLRFRQARHTSNDRRRRRSAGRSRRGRALRLLLLLALLALIAGLALVAGLYVSFMGGLPSLEAQGEYVAAQTSKIYADGEGPDDPPRLLAELHGVENREVVDGDRIPAHMRDAVVAIEDERFYSHQGVDLLAIMRALWADIRHGEIVQGGSTITQQYIKNAYISDEKTIDRKITEAALAFQLERQWSKEKILNAYLNTIYFGEGAYGVEAAAQEYFGIHASELSVPQSALLAAITKSPANYSPRKDESAALDRRNLVLNKMFQQGYISGAELQEALAEPITLVAHTAEEGTLVPYWVEMVREQLVAKYGANTVLQGGLRVYTSIDLRLQTAAEEVIASVLDEPGDPAAALVAIDVRSGEVLAMVGGKDFGTSQFNLALQGRRQPGSAFKPFVLVTALTQGIPPTREYDSGPFTVELPGDDWRVDSSDQGPMTLAEATAESVNGVYARLVMEVGAHEVAETARQLGIETPLEDNPAIALGGLRTGVTPLEMAVAYTTLASGGDRLSGSTVFEAEHPLFPITITRVETADGTVLDENHLVRTPVLDPRVAATTTDVLRAVITRGTGAAADIGRPAAGKTGTTQEYRDAWFVGYTPEIATAVWVGYPDEQRAMLDVHGIKVTGGSFPALIWAGFMREALAGRPPTEFPGVQDARWVTVEIDPTTGLLATEWCPERVEASFFVGEEPTEYCYQHQPTEIEMPDVRGTTAEQARRTLEDAGLLVEIRDEETSGYPAGIVLDQEPAAGASIMQGSSVTLVVSRRPASVPGVIGLSIAAARAALEAAGYLIAESSVVSEAPVGTIVDQMPAEDTPLPPGGTVQVVVSSGPPTETSVAGTVVPDVTGQRLAQALAELQRAGLQGTLGGSVVGDDPGMAGRVAAQSPGAGTSVPIGSVIELTVYAKP